MACDRKIGPFDCCSVVCGDCLELMKQLPDGCVDAVITDPPYGIKAARKEGFGSGVKFYRSGEMKGKPRIQKTDYGDSTWDDTPCSAEQISEIRRISERQVIFGGNYFTLPPSSCWLVWDKKNTGDFADCELAWTNLEKAVRKIEWMWNGMIRQGDDIRVHPTQKPEGVMLWVVGQVGECETILDPFCGSGTTLVAAKKLGRHFLGFEISPEYCEIARDRLARIDAQPSLFTPKPEQLELGQ